MAKLVIVIDSEMQSLHDPVEVAEQIVGGYFARHPNLHRLESASWDGPLTFMRPKDHDKRIAQMEARAERSLGKRLPAALLFTAYELYEFDAALMQAERDANADQ